MVNFVEKIKEVSYQLAIKAVLISRQVELTVKEKQAELIKLKDVEAFA